MEVNKRYMVNMIQIARERKNLKTVEKHFFTCDFFLLIFHSLVIIIVPFVFAKCIIENKVVTFTTLFRFGSFYLYIVFGARNEIEAEKSLRLHSEAGCYFSIFRGKQRYS